MAVNRTPHIYHIKTRNGGGVDRRRFSEIAPTRRHAAQSHTLVPHFVWVPPQDPCLGVPPGNGQVPYSALTLPSSTACSQFLGCPFFIPPTPAFPGPALPSICLKIPSCPQKLSSPDSLQRPRVDYLLSHHYTNTHSLQAVIDLARQFVIEIGFLTHIHNRLRC